MYALILNDKLFMGQLSNPVTKQFWMHISLLIDTMILLMIK